jgi:Family of unknown function (DUF6519)
MKGDFSRSTFNPARHFTRVLMQQGRVQLDSDFNEQVDMLWYYLRTLATDLIGPYGGPDSDELGFKIVPRTVPGSAKVLEDLSIGFGRYYVDGILCENTAESMLRDTDDDDDGRVSRAEYDYGADEDADEHHEHEEAMGGLPTKIKRQPRPHGRDEDGMTYYRQDGYTLAADDARSRYGELPSPPFLVYLDVWERSVSAIEDPDIREVALGGPDTSARSQVVWRVRVASMQGIPNIDRVDCMDFAVEEATREFWRELTNKVPPERRGRLAAKAREPRAEESTDPCIISPDARYRGAENQLYRVEIHTGGAIGDAAPPTFKWSRDNGSNVYPIVMIKEKMVFLEHLGRDARSGLQAGDWVEVVDDEYTSLGKPKPLIQVESVDSAGMTITLKTPAANVSQSRHPFLRRWDQRAGDTNTGGLEINDDASNVNRDNAALIRAEWLDLEDGIQVFFEAGRTFVAGDYWLIPARTATGNIEWPSGEKVLLQPRGVNHHYAPLAGVFFGAHGSPGKEVFFVTDYRRRIDPLATCFVKGSPE